MMPMISPLWLSIIFEIPALRSGRARSSSPMWLNSLQSHTSANRKRLQLPSLNWLQLEFSHGPAGRDIHSEQNVLEQSVQPGHPTPARGHSVADYSSPRTATGVATSTTSPGTSDKRAASSTPVHHSSRRRSPRARALHPSGGARCTTLPCRHRWLLHSLSEYRCFGIVPRSSTV